MKTSQDVLNEWKLRSYITAEQAADLKYKSYINQAKDSILSYCNIPLSAQMPDGLFYAWVEIAWTTAKGATMVQGSGAVKSFSEGDTSITYDVGTAAVKVSTVTADYTTILNRFRRLP